MLLSEKSERAVEACYDAALAPALWPSALQILGESVGADSCTFATGDPVADPLRMPRSAGHEDFAQLWLRNEPHAPDPHATRVASLFKTGRGFVLEEEISTEEERRRLPYYQETARAGNRDWWAGACFKVEARSWCLPLYRSAGRGPFSVAEAKRAVALGSHLSRIIGFAEKFADKAATSGLRALDRFKCAAIVIDAAGVARHLNRQADNLLGADFHLARGRPAASDRRSNRRLQNLISAAIDGDRACSPSGPIIVERDSAPWLLVDAVPVTAFGNDFFNPGRTILTLTDLTVRQMPDASVLTIAFGLTRAEARLALALAAGVGLDDAAKSIGIGRETARSQLKSVFLKTATSRQAELASLLARFV